MRTQAEHTPAKLISIGRYLNTDADDGPVIEVSPLFPVKESSAIAERIAMTYNLHDELVEALNDLVRHTNTHNSVAFIKALAVLAKVKP